MASQRCWSSIVAGYPDRAALRLDPRASSLIACELADGHTGLHASDGSRGGAGRRPWLLWGTAPGAGRSCRELAPCPGRSADGRACSLFAGHDGMHRFPASRVSAAKPAPASASSGGTTLFGRHERGSTAGTSGVPWKPRSATNRESLSPDLGTSEDVVSGSVTSSPATRATRATRSESAKRGSVYASIDALLRDTERTSVVSPDLPPVPSPITFGPDGRGGALVDAAAEDSAPTDYTDPTRTSLVEVIGLDGSARTVVAPISVDGSAAKFPVAKFPAVEFADAEGEDTEIEDAEIENTEIEVAEIEVEAGDPDARSAVADEAAEPAFALGAIEVRYAGTEYRVPQAEPGGVVVSAASSLPTTTVTRAGSADTATHAASAAVAHAAQTLAAIPDEMPQVRTQVGEALRDLADALARLADGLDPR